MHRIHPVLDVAPVALLAGCATLHHGPVQRVEVTSNPPGATVFLDNEAQEEKTPTTLTLRRSSEGRSLRIEKDGYLPYSTTLASDMSDWTYGDVVMLGPIGVVLDMITGSFYEYRPGTVAATLRKPTSGPTPGPVSPEPNPPALPAPTPPAPVPAFAGPPQLSLWGEQYRAGTLTARQVRDYVDGLALPPEQRDRFLEDLGIPPGASIQAAEGR